MIEKYCRLMVLDLVLTYQGVKIEPCLECFELYEPSTHYHKHNCEITEKGKNIRISSNIELDVKYKHYWNSTIVEEMFNSTDIKHKVKLLVPRMSVTFEQRFEVETYSLGD